MEDINTDYMWMGQISFKKIFNYGRGENISFDVIFLQIGREKGEFQILLDALDKIKTKVRVNHFPSTNLRQYQLSLSD
jgi:hypothetical protein